LCRYISKTSFLANSKGYTALPFGAEEARANDATAKFTTGHASPDPRPPATPPND
jgi:hypothetical protein